MNSSYCFNHENNETNISFYTILLNACAKGTCISERVVFLEGVCGSESYSKQIEKKKKEIYHISH